MIIFTMRTHGPCAITKCYLPCADCWKCWYALPRQPILSQLSHE